MFNRPIIKTPREVNDIPEDEKYIQRSFLERYVIDPISVRIAWLLVALLSIVASPILFGKSLLNLCFGEFRGALASFTFAIVTPIVGTLFSTASFIMPTRIGSKFIKKQFFHAPDAFVRAVQVPKDHRSVADEVGPRPTPENNEMYHTYFPFLTQQTLPKNRTFPEVKCQGILVDTMDLPYEPDDAKKESPSDRYRVVINDTAYLYQFRIEQYASQKILHTHTRLFNYPSVTRQSQMHDLTDCINTGIAEVYDLAKRHQWNNYSLEKHLHLYSYCSGVVVALQILLYFKQKHNVDLNIVVDRGFVSFQESAAVYVQRASGLPESFAKLYWYLLLYAGGRFHHNSLDAIKHLDTQKIHYINLGLAQKVPEDNSLKTKLKNFLGIGWLHPDANNRVDADPVVKGETSFADGVERNNFTCGKSTSEIFTGLDIAAPHRFYASNLGSHIHTVPLEQLYVDSSVSDKTQTELQQQGRTALGYYAGVLNALDVAESESKSSLALQ